MSTQRLLGMLAVAAAASTGFAAINLSAPALVKGTGGTGAKIQFTSDQAGYAVVYIMAQNVPGYNAGEIVQTLRGNMVAGLNEFLWNGSNALIRNPNLVNGGPGLSNNGVMGAGMIPDGSQVIIRVTAMNQALWNADWVVGTQGNPPHSRFLGIDVRNGIVFAGDCGNSASTLSNKVIRLFNASTGANLNVFNYGTIANNITSTEPWDIFGEDDGSYFVVSRYAPAGSGFVAGCIYQFDASGALVANVATGIGYLRTCDRLGTGASSIFYAPINGSAKIQRSAAGVNTTAVTNAQVPALLNPTGVGAVDNGANVAPVLYVAADSGNIGVLRLDWNGSGYVMNKIFAKNFWTDQNVFTWTMLNIGGNITNLTVLGTIGTVTSTTSNGPWGNAFYGIALANKGDVNSDIFVRTTGAVWRLHPDGTSAWPGRVLIQNNFGYGADLAWDGTALYMVTGNTSPTTLTGRWIVRDAFPDSGEVVNSSPQTWNASLLPVSTSRLTVE